MTHIMVDVETTDTDPHRGGILQIAAVKFNPKTRTVGKVFDQCPMLLPTRRWGESTRGFWMGGANRPVYDRLIARAQPAAAVFKAFEDFCCEDAPFGGYTFVAKPVKFDWPFVESHMVELGLTFPFAHHKLLDLHSVISGLRGECDRTSIEDEVPFPVGGDKHNALHDCAWQIDMLHHALANHIKVEIVS